MNGPLPACWPDACAGPWSKLVFDEEFNGPGLDTSRWMLGWFQQKPTDTTQPITRPPEVGCYDPANLTVLNGALSIRAISEPNCKTIQGDTYQYGGGMISTRTHSTYLYGVYEIRFKDTPSATNGRLGNYPYFVLMGDQWPAFGEFDVVEGLGGTASYHYHYAGNNGQDTSAGGDSKGPGNQPGVYHTYAVDWEPGIARWFYDGVLVWTFTQSISNHALYIHAVYGVGENTSIPGQMDIDYIRGWQH
jgi:beta-glucanase (GH16 family)